MKRYVSVEVHNEVDVSADEIFESMSADEWHDALRDLAKDRPEVYAEVLTKVGLRDASGEAPDPLAEHIQCVRATKRRVA